MGNRFLCLFRFAAMESLSQEQVDEFRSAFDMFSDGGDTIDKKTLRAVMKQLGMKPTDDVVTEMIEEGDSAGRGKMDFTEFCTMMARRMSSVDPDTLLGAFECFDPTGRGTIPQDEFRKLLLEMGPSKFTDKEVRELMKMGDAGDGLVDYSAIVQGLSGQ